MHLKIIVTVEALELSTVEELEFTVYCYHFNVGIAVHAS